MFPLYLYVSCLSLCVLSIFMFLSSLNVSFLSSYFCLKAPFVCRCYVSHNTLICLDTHPFISPLASLFKATKNIFNFLWGGSNAIKLIGLFHSRCLFRLLAQGIVCSINKGLRNGPLPSHRYNFSVNKKSNKGIAIGVGAS